MDNYLLSTRIDQIRKLGSFSRDTKRSNIPNDLYKVGQIRLSGYFGQTKIMKRLAPNDSSDRSANGDDRVAIELELRGDLHSNEGFDSAEEIMDVVHFKRSNFRRSDTDTK